MIKYLISVLLLFLLTSCGNNPADASWSEHWCSKTFKTKKITAYKNGRTEEEVSKGYSTWLAKYHNVETTSEYWHCTSSYQAFDKKHTHFRNPWHNCFLEIYLSSEIIPAQKRHSSICNFL